MKRKEGRINSGLEHGRPRERVEVSLDPNREFVEVTFTNEGERAVVIEEVGFEDADGRHFELDAETGRVVFGDGATGARLPAGSENMVATYRSSLDEWRDAVRARELVLVAAYCRDATGRYFKTPLSQEIRCALLE